MKTTRHEKDIQSCLGLLGFYLDLESQNFALNQLQAFSLFPVYWWESSKLNSELFSKFKNF